MKNFIDLADELSTFNPEIPESFGADPFFSVENYISIDFPEPFSFVLESSECFSYFNEDTDTVSNIFNSFSSSEALSSFSINNNTSSSSFFTSLSSVYSSFKSLSDSIESFSFPSLISSVSADLLSFSSSSNSSFYNAFSNLSEVFQQTYPSVSSSLFQHRFSDSLTHLQTDHSSFFRSFFAESDSKLYNTNNEATAHYNGTPNDRTILSQNIYYPSAQTHPAPINSSEDSLQVLISIAKQIRDLLAKRKPTIETPLRLNISGE